MMSIKTIAFALGAALIATLHGPSAFSQDKTASSGISRGQATLPYAVPRFEGTIGTTFKDSDPAAFPKPVAAPEGAPNILLIMLDDVGFGQFAATSGGVPAPNLEKLANEGLMYNRFHTTALCSPTRAAFAHRAQSPRGRNGHYYRAGHGL